MIERGVRLCAFLRWVRVPPEAPSLDCGQHCLPWGFFVSVAFPKQTAVSLCDVVTMNLMK